MTDTFCDSKYRGRTNTRCIKPAGHDGPHLAIPTRAAVLTWKDRT